MSRMDSKHRLGTEIYEETQGEEIQTDIGRLSGSELDSEFHAGKCSGEISISGTHVYSDSQSARRSGKQ